MERVRVTLNLPEELVTRAKSAGLLSDDGMERLLTSELDRQQRVDRLFDKLDRLSEVEPLLTPEEIDAEIKAHRRAKRPRGTRNGQ